jgi:hypothetical protein
LLKHSYALFNFLTKIFLCLSFFRFFSCCIVSLELIKYQIKPNKTEYIQDLKKQTALRLAQEQTTEPAFTEQTPVGRGEQLYPRQNSATTPTPTVSYPQQYSNQNYPLQQQQNQQQHMMTTTGTNYSKPIIHTSSADHGQQQQQQSSGYLGARASHDLNYMQPQNQNVFPAGPPPTDSHILVSCYRSNVVIILEKSLTFIYSYMNKFAFMWTVFLFVAHYYNLYDYRIYCMQGSHYTSNYAHGPVIDPQLMPPTSTVCISPNNMQQQHQQQQSSLSPSSMSAQQQPIVYTHDISHSHMTSIARNSNTNNMSKNNKLPHGLTVYELKEMTKARLQCEKSNDADEIQVTSRERGVSPLDFEYGEAILENANYDSVAATTAYLPNHHVASPNMLQQQQQQPSSQMFQSGFHPSNMIGGGSVPQQSFRTTTARTDTWESTSVASHNSTIYSENLGSESASEVGSFGQCSSNRNRSFTYPAGQVARPPDVPTASTGYKESSYSYSNSSSTQASPHGSAGIFGASSSLFSAAVGGNNNRRRAVTLSPNTGSILEDRPLRYGDLEPVNRLEIPNFNFSPGTPAASLSVAPPIQNNQRGYSPVLVLDNSFLSNGTGSSGVFRNTSNDGSSLQRVSPISQVDPRGEYEITKNNSFFLREATCTETRVPVPPPGFLTSNTASSRHTAFSRVGSVDSVPEASSSDSNNIGKSYFWGQSNNNQYNRSHLVSEDNLASDFGSVLDLSGSTGRERASTYTYGSNQTIGNNSCTPTPDVGFPF